MACAFRLLSFVTAATVALVGSVACGSRTGLFDLLPGGPSGTGDSGVRTFADAGLSYVCPYTEGVQAGAPWPMSGHCPNQQHLATAGSEVPNSAAWVVDAGSPDGSSGFGSASIGADGMVYSSAGGFTRSTLEARHGSGEMAWTFATDGFFADPPALGPDGTLYAVSSAAQGPTTTVHALDPQGRLVWSTSFSGDGNRFAPIVAPNGALLITDSSALRALVGRDVAWAYTFPTNGTNPLGPPAVAPDGTIYVGVSGDPNLLAVDPAGNALWQFSIRTVDPRYELGADVFCSPAVGADGTIYVQSGLNSDANDHSYTTVYAVSPGGDLLWSKDFGSAEMGGPGFGLAIAGDGSIVATSTYGALASITASGALAWTLDVGDTIESAPAIAADGTIYAAGQYHSKLYAISPQGVLLWSRPIGVAGLYGSPALAANGNVIVGSYDGILESVGR